MIDLNLPKYEFKVRKIDNNRFEIFDEFRKKYIVLTPEEWVRQNFLHFLVTTYGYPKSLIEIEKSLKINDLQKRLDALIYNKKAEPKMIIEFKAPHIRLSQKVFDQAARYNLIFKVPYLLISNGNQHYCAHINQTDKKIVFKETIPTFNTLNE